MQRHIIVELLGIKDKQVDVWNIEEEGSALRVELYTRQRQQKCPFCKEKTKQVHGYRNQAIQGPVLSNNDEKTAGKGLEECVK
ncbi:hypothetical protein [Sediminibacillus terrae]|uniref:hypothetical protein n=1 Tax=Sediminibacillus terrae TaxID=1562106 RepID=UPI001F40AF0D|nr:hypothetical protein [Sediminibacillus terrae]